MSADSARGMLILSMMERDISSAAYTSGVFDIVNTQLLHDQLSRFGCVEERCLSGFARDAKISVLITCSARDLGDNVLVTCRAFGSDLPYDGKIIREMTYRLPMKKGTSREEQGYLADEISVRYIAELFSSYKRSVTCGFSDGKLSAGEPLTGRYTVIMAEETASGYRPYTGLGERNFSQGVASGSDVPKTGAVYVLVTYPEKAAELKKLLLGRKKEIVFYPPSYGETVFGAVLAPVMSAAMPLVSPLGYYTYGDYKGLGLWSANFAPWAYVEYKGISRGFPAMKGSRSSASPDSVAQHYFSWYMLCAGNLPLFVDAAFSSRLESAALYKSREQYLGNTATAVALSAVSGGGGMFYRGRRGWGYFYFQADNILLYLTLRSSVASRERDHSGIGVRDFKRGNSCALYLSSFLALKGVEIAHVILSDDRLDAAEEKQGQCSLVPGANFTAGNVSLSMAVSYAL